MDDLRRQIRLARRRLAAQRFLSVVPRTLTITMLLAVVAILTVARRSLGFAFSKPTTDMLYSVVTPEEKYKAKNFIDTAIYRGGDLVGTWGVKSIWAMGVAGISFLMVPLAIAWAAVSIWLGRDYRRRAKQGIGSE